MKGSARGTLDEFVPRAVAFGLWVRLFLVSAKYFGFGSTQSHYTGITYAL
jgi:hypothetical protein